MADQDTLGVTAMTNAQRDYRGRPLFLCQKIVILFEFCICLGVFSFENDPHDRHRHTPATTGSWRPASLAGSYAPMIQL